MNTLPMALGILAVIVGGGAAWWWFIGRNRPRYLPLAIEDDDPEMLEARAKAKATIQRLRELHAEAIHECQVKVPFVSSSGVTENLASELLEIADDTLKVRYLTPPVTHSGRLERVHHHSLSELVDWVVFRKDGLIEGGFTQRVMFSRARAQNRSLPPELQEQSSRYVA